MKEFDTPQVVHSKNSFIVKYFFNVSKVFENLHYKKFVKFLLSKQKNEKQAEAEVVPSSSLV